MKKKITIILIFLVLIMQLSCWAYDGIVEHRGYFYNFQDINPLRVVTQKEKAVFLKFRGAVDGFFISDPESFSVERMIVYPDELKIKQLKDNVSAYLFVQVDNKDFPCFVFKLTPDKNVKFITSIIITNSSEKESFKETEDLGKFGLK